MLGFLLLAVSVALPARAESGDEVWTSFGARHWVADTVRLDVSQHLRFDQGLSRLHEVMPETAVAWDLTGWARVGAGYRYAQKRGKDDAFKAGHRVHVQARARLGVEPVSLSYRIRFQERIELGARPEFKHTVRNRLSLEVGSERSFTPGMAIERFTVLAGGVQAEKSRQTAFLEYRPVKQHVLEGFVRREISLEDPAEPVVRIFGLDYQYRFPKK